MTLEDLPPTISVEEAGELCGIGRNAAYRAAHRGELPAFRIGRQLRVPTARLLQLLGLPVKALTESDRP
jgi:excisionase family DNA binding protein